MRTLAPLVLAFAIAEIVFSGLNVAHATSPGGKAFWVGMAVVWVFNAVLWGSISLKAWRE